jgi:hypothetical protein
MCYYMAVRNTRILAMEPYDRAYSIMRVHLYLYSKVQSYGFFIVEILLSLKSYI